MAPGERGRVKSRATTPVLAEPDEEGNLTEEELLDIARPKLSRAKKSKSRPKKRAVEGQGDPGNGAPAAGVGPAP